MFGCRSDGGYRLALGVAGSQRVCRPMWEFDWWLALVDWSRDAHLHPTMQQPRQNLREPLFPAVGLSNIPGLVGASIPDISGAGTAPGSHTWLDR